MIAPAEKDGVPLPPAGPEERSGSALRAGLGALAVCAAAYIHCAWMSWRRWGELLFDAGRELELPARVADGGVLYVDVRNLYGPLPMWINAALYRLLGVHVDVLIGAGLVTAAAMGAALFFLARRFLGRAPATAVAVTFFYACAFAHLTSNAIFNFVLPYSYAATYGVLLGCLSLLFLVRSIQTASDRSLGLSLLFAGLALLCKLEIALAVTAAHVVHVIGLVLLRRMSRRRAGAYAAAAAAVAGVYGLLHRTVGPGLWSDNIFSAAGVGAGASERPILAYARWSMGLDDVPGSLGALALSAGLLAAALALGAGAGRLAARTPGPRRRRAVAAAVALAVAAAYALVPITVPLRVLPLVAALGLGWGLVRWVRRGEDRPGALADLVLWAFIAACLSRQLLRVVPEHYGFYLVAVPLVGLAVFVFRDVPGWLRASPSGAVASRAAAGGVLAGVALGCLAVSAAEYARHGQRIETPRGDLILRDETGAQAELVRFLSGLPRHWRAIVVPQGAGYVFMGGLTWNDGTFAYAPSDLTGTYDDAHLPGRWAARPPDVVVFLRLAGAYGASEFGAGYAERSSAWLSEHYRFSAHPSGFLVGLPRAPRAEGAP